jgi:hypothetical protein
MGDGFHSETQLYKYTDMQIGENRFDGMEVPNGFFGPTPDLILFRLLNIGRVSLWGSVPVLTDR